MTHSDPLLMVATLYYHTTSMEEQAFRLLAPGVLEAEVLKEIERERLINEHRTRQVLAQIQEQQNLFDKRRSQHHQACDQQKRGYRPNYSVHRTAHRTCHTDRQHYHRT
jgi:hypothetical protein